MSERCERTSVPIFGCSEPQCPAEKDRRFLKTKAEKPSKGFSLLSSKERFRGQTESDLDVNWGRGVDISSDSYIRLWTPTG